MLRRCRFIRGRCWCSCVRANSRASCWQLVALCRIHTAQHRTPSYFLIGPVAVGEAHNMSHLCIIIISSKCRWFCLNAAGKERAAVGAEAPAASVTLPLLLLHSTKAKPEIGGNWRKSSFRLSCPHITIKAPEDSFYSGFFLTTDTALFKKTCSHIMYWWRIVTDCGVCALCCQNRTKTKMRLPMWRPWKLEFNRENHKAVVNLLLSHSIRSHMFVNLFHNSSKSLMFIPKYIWNY